MLAIENLDTYWRERSVRDDTARSMFARYDAWPVALLFGAVGAVTWAVRGTTGWGGIDGTLVPGLTWGLLWYYICQKRGIDARGISLWLGLSLSIGGELGYGQYTSWIRGQFAGPDGPLPISPLVGYAWLFICGAAWGATGAIVLGWVLGGRTTALRWVVRLVVPVLLGVLGWRLVHAWPTPFFPYYGAGYYAGTLPAPLERTVYTNTQNFAVFAWFIGAMLIAAMQRDRSTLVAGSVVGAGFGVAFAISTSWCIGYAYAPQFVDWWKLWEMSAGFLLGVLYAVVMFWAVRQLDARYESDNAVPVGHGETTFRAETIASVCWAAACFALVFVSGFEYFPITGTLLGLFYVVSVGVAAYAGYRTGNPRQIAENRMRVSLEFASFFLWFILFYGVSSRAGVVFGLYDDKAIDQYAWPASRVALFTPVAAVLVGKAVFAMWTAIYKLEWKTNSDVTTQRISARTLVLVLAIGAVGAVSIWPSKIGVCYSVAIAAAVAALFRIERQRRPE